MNNINSASSGNIFLGTYTTSADNVKKNDTLAYNTACDSVTLSHNQNNLPPDPKNCPKIFGMVGTAIGAAVGKAALPLATGITVAAAFTATLAGPIAIAGAALLGLVGGALAEKYTASGTLAGGIAGAGAGYIAGKVAEKLGHIPTEKYSAIAQKFDFEDIPSKIKSSISDELKGLSGEQQNEILTKIKPGDILVTEGDGLASVFINTGQKLLGVTGNWLHGAMVGESGTILEMRQTGYQEVPIDNLFAQEDHIMILRPEYKSEENVKDTLAAMRENKNAKYDFALNLQSDEKLYCTELIYKSLKKGAPDINVDESKSFGRNYVLAQDFLNSPDINVVYSTGSQLYVNELKKLTEEK